MAQLRAASRQPIPCRPEMVGTAHQKVRTIWVLQRSELYWTQDTVGSYLRLQRP